MVKSKNLEFLDLILKPNAFAFGFAAICNNIINNNKLVNKYNINNLVIDNIKINEIIIELKTNDNKQKDEIKN
jgi:hypothetical protein